jgi:hypothetical protein
MVSLSIGEYLIHYKDGQYVIATEDINHMLMVKNTVLRAKEQNYQVETRCRNTPEGKYRFYFIVFDTNEEAIEFKLKFL